MLHYKQTTSTHGTTTVTMSTVSNTTNATNTNILHLHQLPARKLKYIITKLQEYVNLRLIPTQTADAIETSLNQQREFNIYGRNL